MKNIDPIFHHPELREKIKPAEESFFRELDINVIDVHAAEAGFPADWRTPCESREAGRREYLEGRWNQDLWFFGYGSLMWDPAFEFSEVRHAHCRGYQRSLCLWDEGGRGSMEEPGLMLAIDEGGECEGLAFRIEAEKLDRETFVMFRREMLAPVYRPIWLSLSTLRSVPQFISIRVDLAKWTTHLSDMTLTDSQGTSDDNNSLCPRIHKRTEP